MEGNVAQKEDKCNYEELDKSEPEINTVFQQTEIQVPQSLLRIVEEMNNNVDFTVKIKIKEELDDSDEDGGKESTEKSNSFEDGELKPDTVCEPQTDNLEVVNVQVRVEAEEEGDTGKDCSEEEQDLESCSSEDQESKQELDDHNDEVSAQVKLEEEEEGEEEEEADTGKDCSEEEQEFESCSSEDQESKPELDNDGDEVNAQVKLEEEEEEVHSGRDCTEEGLELCSSEDQECKPELGSAGEIQSEPIVSTELTYSRCGRVRKLPQRYRKEDDGSCKKLKSSQKKPKSTQKAKSTPKVKSIQGAKDTKKIEVKKERQDDSDGVESDNDDFEESKSDVEEKDSASENSESDSSEYEEANSDEEIEEKYNPDQYNMTGPTEDHTYAKMPKQAPKR